MSARPWRRNGRTRYRPCHGWNAILRGWRGRRGQSEAAIFRRKATYEELHPETNAGVAGASARWNGKDANENSAFASATSDAIGKSRRSVEIAAARGEALGDDLGAVTGTSLDKGVELDALAKMPKDERKWLAAKEPLPAFAHGRLGWSFSRYLELLPIVTPINASTDATVMTPINATPVAVPDLLYLRVVNVFPRGDAWLRR